MKDEEMNDSSSAPVLKQITGSGSQNMIFEQEFNQKQGDTEISEFKINNINAQEKKVRLERFWNEQTASYVAEKISPIDRTDLEDP